MLWLGNGTLLQATLGDCLGGYGMVWNVWIEYGVVGCDRVLYNVE